MQAEHNNALQFGTGGIRGIIGDGADQMNIQNVKRVAMGVCNYLKKLPFSLGEEKHKIIIAYDSRQKSSDFAETAASVFASNGMHVFLFDHVETTPMLSFALRHLKCVSGFCITASHNPPQYNGIKVYWSNGAQIVPPHDEYIINNINSINMDETINTINFNQALKSKTISFIDDSVKLAYFKDIENTLSYYLPNFQTNNQPKDLTIVYTPLHGTGGIPTEHILKQLQFKKLFIVPEQSKPDGRFPTIKKPNPEEPEALTLALQYAEEKNSDIIFATDPDSDRLAVCVKDGIFAKNIYKNQSKGNYVLLNGNQTGALITYFILKSMKSANKLDNESSIIKTMVTSRLIELICRDYNVNIFNTPTGFKWVAKLIELWTTKNLSKTFLFGAEESFGYMFSNNVRDKDGIMGLAFVSEMAWYFKKQNKTLCNILFELFHKYGAWQEDLISIDCEPTPEGMAKISNIMQSFRDREPKSFCGISVKDSIDYLNRQSSDDYPFPKLDVLQYNLVDNSQISMRPSGTEPKLKVYLSVCTKLNNVENAVQETQEKIKAFRTEILRLLQKTI